MFREFLNGRGNDTELCGMFVGTPIHDHSAPVPRDLRLVELPNRSDRPDEAYVIQQGDVTRALRRSRRTADDIVGFWHTHPQPFLPGPSRADLDAITLGAKHWWHAVYHPDTGLITWYDYYENIIEEKDSDHAVRAVRTRRGPRVDRVRGPRQRG